VSSEVFEVTKSAQCSMVDKMISLCGSGNVIAAPPTINALMSNTTTDLSSEPPSKTSTGVTNTGCKVSSYGTPATQDSSYSLKKKISETKVLIEVLQVINQCSVAWWTK